METLILDVLKEYGFSENEVQHLAPYGDGLINRTYRFFAKGKAYLLQKINTDVFKNPEGLMNNFTDVTAFLKEKIAKNGGDPEREALTIVKTLDGKNFVETRYGAFRVMLFIDAISINAAEEPEQLVSVAATFGKFQNMLADYPADTLFEVIPDFHNTPKRFEHLETAIKENAAGRLHLVTDEVNYALSMKQRICAVVDGFADGTIPLRVSHNDTKLNNVLLDKETKTGICVIDLDTVMPGSYLYDYGDALRFAGNNTIEDDPDLSKVYLNFENFAAFTEGYLSEVKSVLTEREIELLPFSILLMAYECGIRFLTDYLNGDTYFKTTYPEHNLVRARNQFKYAQNLDENMGKMSDFIKKLL